MKYLLLAVVILPSVLLAQVPQPIQARPTVLPRVQAAPSEALPDNYQVTLTMNSEGEQPLEVSVVVASTRFEASLGSPALNFSGTVTVEESGKVIIAYLLGWETPVVDGDKVVQFRPASTQGSVRLGVGEEIQIIRAGPRVARLSIKKLEPTKSR